MDKYYLRIAQFLLLFAMSFGVISATEETSQDRNIKIGKNILRLGGK